VKTVKVHRARMLSKMKVRSVAELVQLAQKVGIAGAVPILVRQAQREAGLKTRAELAPQSSAHGRDVAIYPVVSKSGSSTTWLPAPL
jgi:hypothetical protein